jgi:hypothetical protein
MPSRGFRRHETHRDPHNTVRRHVRHDRALPGWSRQPKHAKFRSLVSHVYAARKKDQIFSTASPLAAACDLDRTQLPNVGQAQRMQRARSAAQSLDVRSTRNFSAPENRAGSARAAPEMTMPSARSSLSLQLRQSFRRKETGRARCGSLGGSTARRGASSGDSGYSRGDWTYARIFIPTAERLGVTRRSAP